MSDSSRKHVSTRVGHQRTPTDGDGRASVLSISSTTSGSSAGSSIFRTNNASNAPGSIKGPNPRLGSTHARSGSVNSILSSMSAANIKLKPNAKLTLATATNSKQQYISQSSSSVNTGVRPSSPVKASRAKSPIPSTIRISTPLLASPKKARNVTFDGPSPSQAVPGTPSKTTSTLSLLNVNSGTGNEDAEEDLSPNHLVDATGVTDLDLSADFDVNEISRMLADEQVEGKGVTDSDDKVLVSIRVKPAEGEETHAWRIDQSEARICVKDQFARTSTGTNNEFRYDHVLTGSYNKPVYETTARRHVRSAMEGFNAVVFAYGQTASGKTFTLTGTDEEPGIIPRAMRDVFGYIKATPDREYLLRASYLEIYNEQIHDLLASGVGPNRAPVNLQGTGFNVTMSPLREEVVTSLKAVKDVMERGESNRRTASTDWNERSSRSHSVFRLVIESRERASEGSNSQPGRPSTPNPTPNIGTGGSRLNSTGASGVRMSVLSLIDLAGSERATSDKERAKEGKYINTSLLTLGTVIGTLAENASKCKSDHVPFRNSKLTRMLQPSLSGDARISVICTLNPSHSALSESLSTLGFASRVKKVALHATKKEIVNPEALIEKYRKEIDELKAKLQEKEASELKLNRRLSHREQADERRDKTDLNLRLKQLSKLILTSNSVDVGTESGSVSPVKLNFDVSPYQLQEELLNAKRRIESQDTQILSLEAALTSRPSMPVLPADPLEDDKDRLIAELQKANKELNIVVQAYEANLNLEEPLTAVKEDVEKEWKGKVEQLEKELEDSKQWVQQLVKELEREKQLRNRLQEEKGALVSFVTDIDLYMRERPSSLSISSLPRLSAIPTLPTSNSTPRSSLGNSGPGSGGNRRRSLGAILIESNNNTRIMSGALENVKEEYDARRGSQKEGLNEDEKENISLPTPSPSVPAI